MWCVLYSVYVTIIYGLTKYVYKYLHKINCVTTNYENKRIVQSFGVNAVLHYILFLVIAFLFERWTMLSIFDHIQPLTFVWMMLVLSIIGWVDDRYGTKKIKGFKGHFQALFSKGKVTTGMMKAVLGLSLAMGVSYHYSPNVWLWFINTFVFVLSVHIINLMDARPGRALKSFWLLTIVVAVLLPSTVLLSIYMPILLSTLLLFHYDRQRLAMLGDTGSIVYGGILGYFLVTTVGLEVKILYLIFFITLSLMAERISFSTYIQSTTWLAKLDRWGIR